MASEAVNNYITKRYERWLDYSLYHCGLAGIAVRGAAGRKLGAQALFDDWRRLEPRGLWRAGGRHGPGHGPHGGDHPGGGRGGLSAAADQRKQQD